MGESSYFRLQLAVFSLVTASFANIYVTQPVLPVLSNEFQAGTVMVSFTVSAVILGISLSNLPFGFIADRCSIWPIVLTGGIVVASGALISAISYNLWVLIAARFVQGLFIPALTTCIAAYLAKTLPPERLNVVMGSYVSATVTGGLGGRLLGGFIHPPLHWRYAFVSAAVLIVVSTIFALWTLPRTPSGCSRSTSATTFLKLLKRWELTRIFLCATGVFGIFSSIFNYLPFRLAGAPFHYSTEMTTMLYLVYVTGIFIGPLAGKISNRYGAGNTMMGSSLVLATALVFLSLPHIVAVVTGLLTLCLGFFTVHAAAVGGLNRKLTGGQGKANALYVLFYYMGGWVGITCCGFAFRHSGWTGVTGFCAVLLLIPLSVGLLERRSGLAAQAKSGSSEKCPRPPHP